MADDLARGRPTEVGALRGEVVRLAKACGTRAPANERIGELVRAQTASPRPMSGAALRATLEL
jgi:2-dehydropantoate 2-reductase